MHRMQGWPKSCAGLHLLMVCSTQRVPITAWTAPEQVDAIVMVPLHHGWQIVRILERERADVREPFLLVGLLDAAPTGEHCTATLESTCGTALSEGARGALTHQSQHAASGQPLIPEQAAQCMALMRSKWMPAHSRLRNAVCAANTSLPAGFISRKSMFRQQYPRLGTGGSAGGAL